MELLNIKERSFDYIASYTFVFLPVKNIKSNNFLKNPLLWQQMKKAIKIA